MNRIMTPKLTPSMDITEMREWQAMRALNRWARAVSDGGHGGEYLVRAPEYAQPPGATMVTLWYGERDCTVSHLHQVRALELAAEMVALNPTLDPDKMKEEP